MARQFSTARSALRLALAASTAVGAWLLAPALDAEQERLIFSVESASAQTPAPTPAPSPRRRDVTPPPQPAQPGAPAPAPAALSQQQQALVARVEQYLNSITTMKARFLQTNAA